MLSIIFTFSITVKSITIANTFQIFKSITIIFTLPSATFITFYYFVFVNK